MWTSLAEEGLEEAAFWGGTEGTLKVYDDGKYYSLTMKQQGNTVFTASVNANDPGELLAVAGHSENGKNYYHRIRLTLEGKKVNIETELLADDDTQNSEFKNQQSQATPAQRMERSPILSWIIALLMVAYLVVKLGFRGGSLDLGIVIMIFLSLGLMLHGTPLAYVRAFGKAATGASGIILQFPFYAGIMGIITTAGSSGVSLGSVISDACISISNPATYPLLTFLSAAVINVFVPSGGGQWAVQAPIMFPAGADLGVDPGLTGIAIAWGDAWTNLIQPFWALPALAIAKLSARDIMGFCLVDLIVTGIIICGGLLVWAL